MSWLNKNKNLILVATLMFLILLLVPHFGNLTIENIVNFAPNSIFMAALIFLLLYAVKAIVMVIPIAVLCISAGMIFPIVWAFVISYFGLSLALSIGYFNGKKLGEEKVTKILEKQKKAAAFLSDRKHNLSSLCFVSRVLPLPFDLLSLFYGALGMSYIKFLLISLLGITPTAIPYMLAGGSINNPLSIEFLAPFGISFAITSVAFIIYTRSSKK